MSVLAEESRPGTAMMMTTLEPGQLPPTTFPETDKVMKSAHSVHPYESMNFIQMGSQDLMYDAKPKAAKVVGRYVLGDTLGEGKRPPSVEETGGGGGGRICSDYHHRLLIGILTVILTVIPTMIRPYVAHSSSIHRLLWKSQRRVLHR